MKIEIDNTQLVDAIVDRVVEQIKPLFNNANVVGSNELLDVQGLANYLKVNKSWVYEKIHKKEIPYHKVGKFPRFRKNEIDIWIKDPYSSDLAKISNLSRKEVLNKEVTKR